MIPLDMMRKAVALGAQAPHSDTELAVGCVIADPSGNILATGYSREDGNRKSHAEKIALEKLPADADFSSLHLFATVEPCGKRLSDNPTCTSLILKSGIKHVYFAMREPAHFVHQDGLDHLRAHGVHVTQVCDEDIFQKVARANPHLQWR